MRGFKKHLPAQIQAIYYHTRQGVVYKTRVDVLDNILLIYSRRITSWYTQEAKKNK